MTNMATKVWLGGNMSDHHFILELIAKYSSIPKSRMGSTQEAIVNELVTPVIDRAKKKISSLNGSGSPIYNPEDITFIQSAKSVAQDIANAIVHDRPEVAILYFEQSAEDVLVQQAHLRLDF